MVIFSFHGKLLVITRGYLMILMYTNTDRSGSPAPWFLAHGSSAGTAESGPAHHVGKLAMDFTDSTMVFAVWLKYTSIFKKVVYSPIQHRESGWHVHKPLGFCDRHFWTNYAPESHRCWRGRRMNALACAESEPRCDSGWWRSPTCTEALKSHENWLMQVLRDFSFTGLIRLQQTKDWEDPRSQGGVERDSADHSVQFTMLAFKMLQLQPTSNSNFLDLFTTIFQTFFKPTSTAAWGPRGPPTLRDKSWCELLRLWRNFLNSKLCRSWMRWTEWLKTTPIWRLVDADVWS